METLYKRPERGEGGKNEDDRMRSEGERGVVVGGGRGRWVGVAGGDEHLIGLTVTGQGKHK